jgi:hypothetical protein
MVLTGGPGPTIASLSQAEILHAIQSLTAGDKTALMKIARLYAQRTPYDHEDLSQEALCRLIDGRRVWPRDVPAVLVLGGVVRSIAWEWRRKELPLNEDPRSVPPNQDWVILLREIIEVFEGKPVLQEILVGILKGMKGQELQDLVEGIDKKPGKGPLPSPTLESMLRMIRRTLEKTVFENSSSEAVSP